MRPVRIVPAITLALCLAALFFTPAACRGEESFDDRKLLDALRAEDFDTREDAKKKLIDRGESIREIIAAEQAKKDLDPDYKRYLKDIASKLKDADVIKAFDNTKRIDLDVKDESVAAVFEKLKTHFGFAAGIQGEGAKKKVSLQLKNASFLEAVDAVRKAANLSYDRNELMQRRFVIRRVGAGAMAGADNNATPTLALIENGDEGEAPCSAKGPVLVFLDSINVNQSKNIQFGNGGKKAASTQKSFNVQGYVITEPGLRFSSIGIPTLSATGANNETLGNGIVYLDRFGSGGADDANGFQVYNFSVTFSPQAEVPEKLSWKLSARILVPVKITEKKFDTLPALVGKPQEFFGGTFTIKTLQAERGGGWKLSHEMTGSLMNISSGDRMSRINGDNMAPGNPEFASGMSILDAHGKPIPSHRSSMQGNGTSNTSELGLNSEPYTIVFRKPGETQVREFELSIPNVPTP